jgi:hypothetical protein
MDLLLVASVAFLVIFGKLRAIQEYLLVTSVYAFSVTIVIECMISLKSYKVNNF